YPGSGPCLAGMVGTTITSTGVLLCTPVIAPSARPLLGEASSAFPAGYNLGAGASGVIKVVVSGSSAVPSTTPAPVGLLVGDTDAQVLSNKRVNYRATSLPANQSPLQIPIGAAAEGYDLFVITELLQDTQIAAPTGTLAPGQIVFFQAKTSVLRNLTWAPIWSGDAGYPL